MTRYTRYRKTFNPTTMADEELTRQEQTAIQASKEQSVEALRASYMRRSRPVCLRCRRPDHSIKNCPEGGVSRCYNCGSWDHTLKDCSQPREDVLRFAECFVCGEPGHLSGQCAKNERGIYPRGGGCRFCGSKQHLAKDCRPTRQAEQGVLVGISRDPKRENPEEDVMFESLSNIQREKKMKRQQREQETPAHPDDPTPGHNASKKKKTKVVSF